IVRQILAVVFAFAVLISCEDEKYMNSPDARLYFSADTIMFDTVFTTIGSTTRILKIFNPYHEKVLISNVRVATGETSNFRLNVNGLSGNEAYDVGIPANDSIFVFVEVTVDPNGGGLPMVVEDSIEFIINENRQVIPMVAWGQDFHLVKRATIKEDTRWSNDKPYLVYDYVFVDSTAVLTIEPGTKIHFHKDAEMHIPGKIIADGTMDSRIVFTSDRLESSYRNVPNQWQGIAIYSGSKGNVFNYTDIRNANIGLHIGTIEHEGTATAILSNVKIENMYYAGIYALNAKITAYNALIANCARHTVALQLGGEYEFYHSTIANFWSPGYSQRVRSTAALHLTNYISIGNEETSQIITSDLTKAFFANCIIYGNLPTGELSTSFVEASLANYYLDHCIVQLPDTFNISNKNHFSNIIKSREYNFPKFIDPIKHYIYELDTLSPAKDAGSSAYAKLFPIDMKGADRLLDDGPDLGAYERVEKKEEEKK
ncbi:MAG: hypothetical protein FWG22_02010, partial [Prolixibacteraceae bacterium]|nr:hypothetical protein [Prolixibacteraceae bacterium]